MLQIVTPRLLLRPLQMPDFEGWAAFMADPEATRYLGGAQPRALAWRSFMTMAGAWHLQGFSMFSVIERSSQRWVGRLGPKDAGRLAGHRGRLGHHPRLLGTRLRGRGRNGRNRLGLR